jgi:RNA polymerase sigma-70 factor, ECF subfamily
MTAPDRFGTPRMVGERLGLEHADQLACLHGDPRVMGALGGVRDRAWTGEWTAAQVAHWGARGFGAYLIRGREGGAFAGCAGLRALEVQPAVEVQCVLVHERWGQGLGTEITGELVRVAFEVLDLPEVVACIQGDQPAARRVLEKVGFQGEPCPGSPEVSFRLRAAEDVANTTGFDQDTHAFAGRARGGDRAAFADLYERVAPALRAWVRLRTTPAFRARLDPEEVLQETWTRALRRLPELDGGTPFRPWIFRVARYVLIELSRGLPRGLPDSGSGGDLLAARPDPASGAATHVARQDALVTFLDRAEALDERDRELVVLRGLEGRSFDEIAERLGVAPGTLGKRWQRLRGRLIEEGPPAYLL